MDGNIFIKFILSLLLGAFIGLEREIHEKNEKKQVKHPSFLGVRTFTLSTFLGALTGILYHAYPIFFILICSTFLILSICYYIFDSINTKDIGITTEIALIFSFIIGVLISLEVLPLQLVIGITIILTLILSRKAKIQGFIQKIEQAELGSFISYLVLALVVLPLLPNQSYSLSDIPQLTQLFSFFNIELGNISKIEIVNPYKLWQIVALITGVDVFGYFLEKTIGQKGGWLLTSFAGGFISSTATTQSLAVQSKKRKTVNHLVSAALVANLASFLQVSIIIASVNILLFTKILPIITFMIVCSLILSVYFLKTEETKNNKELKSTKEKLKKGKIFDLLPAIKFALIFVFIKLISQVVLSIFGTNGFLISVGFGAIPGIDAVLINVAQLAGSALTFQTAVWAFILINAVNLTTKSVYSFLQGKKEFAVKFFLSILAILTSGGTGLLIFSR